MPGNEGEGGAGVKCPIEPTTAEGLRACLPLEKSLPTGVSFFSYSSLLIGFSLSLVDMFVV